MKWIRNSVIAMTVLCCATIAQAGTTDESGPAFGPQTFEITEGEAASYTETFETDAAGPYMLYLRNGDGDAGAADSAMVTLNGTVVIGGDDVGADSAGAKRPVELAAGENTLTVDLTGAVGSYVTVAIARPEHRPKIAHGRLLLPWAAVGDDRALTLAVKNGSHRAPRAFRVVFFNPDGSVAGASERMLLPPRGSRLLHVGEMLDASADAAWRAGSVEIFWAGPGTARLFGAARLVSPTSGEAEALPLEPAGYRVFRAPPENGRR